MVIGILSDTHDRADAMAAGLEALRAAGAEFFVHCGDIGGEAMLDLLAGLPGLFVWGNCDFDRADLTRYAVSLGIDCRGEFADLEVQGKKIGITHGDNPRLMNLAAARQYDYLLHGHTHAVRDERAGKLRIINPGALHRAAKKTVAVLDPVRDSLRYLTVEI